MCDKKVDYNEILMGINTKVKTFDNKIIRAINFDNAATTPPFKSVIDKIIKLSEYYGSIGRGAGHKSEMTTYIYHESKKYLMNFFNIKDKNKYIVIYVNNTTDGINKLARILPRKKDDIVLLTRMEHHSNDLPWRKNFNVDYVEVDEEGRLKIDEFEKKFKEHKGKIKYVSVTGASNVTGYLNDIHKIAEIAHKYKSKIIVDGAQLVPHKKVDMWGKGKDSIDFLVFSGHKLYAPFGGGAIIGLKKVFEEGITDDEGGGTVNIVMDNWIEYLSSPEKNEAGTPNYFGAVSIVEALKTLDKIGFHNIHKHEIILRDRLFEGLKAIPKVFNYGDMEKYDDRLGIGVFNIEYLYHQMVAEELAKIYGVSVRQGWFCAHPYCRRLMHISEKTTTNFIYDKRVKMPGMIRVSFGIYNRKEEVDYFLEAVEKISKDFS